MGRGASEGYPQHCGDKLLDGTGSTHGGRYAYSSNLPGFASGGVVPGPLGAPQLAVVHGGETIIPAGRPRTTGT